MMMTPRQILTQLINSEHDLRVFCDDHGIHLGDKAHTWDYVIEAYSFLQQKLKDKEQFKTLL